MENKQLKSNVCALKKGSSRLDAILSVTENSAGYLGLDKKQRMQLRLLSEELVGMLPELLVVCEGEFWIEKEGENVELHVSAIVSSLDKDDRERLLSISSTGVNTAAVGVMGKIRSAAENLMRYVVKSASVAGSAGGFDAVGYVWSLSCYRESHSRNKDTSAWDELERSIIANIADDVRVSIIGDNVEIVVIKKFM